MATGDGFTIKEIVLEIKDDVKDIKSRVEKLERAHARADAREGTKRSAMTFLDRMAGLSLAALSVFVSYIVSNH